MAARQVNVSTSTRYSTLLDMDDRGLTELVRASVHYYNTEEEVDRFCAVLETLIRGA
jgi:selenocysteine lyase/cysteine desulfurase